MKVTRELVGELLGTFVLVLFGCGSVAVSVLFDAHHGLMQVALAWGIGVMLAIYLTRHLSCAHLNPAVSLAMVVSGRMRFRKLPGYLAAQFAGAVLAGLALYVLFAPSIAAYENAHHIVRGTAESVRTGMMFGEYYPNPGSAAVVSLPLAMGAEALGTFLLALMIFALTEGCNVGRPVERPGACVHRIDGNLHHLSHRAADTSRVESRPRSWPPARRLGYGMGDGSFSRPRGRLPACLRAGPIAGRQSCLAAFRSHPGAPDGFSIRSMRLRGSAKRVSTGTYERTNTRMNSEEAYFDYAASAPPFQEALRAQAEAAARWFGNPSATHPMGREAREEWGRLRDAFAALCGFDGQLVLASGATEANNLVIHGLMRRRPEARVLVAADTHASVWDACRRYGRRRETLPLQADGTLSLADLAGRIAPDTALFCCSHISNETGVIHDVAAMAALCERRGVPCLVDGSQAMGHVRVDLSVIGCDFYTFSAHKFGGPRGVGGLMVRSEPGETILDSGRQQWGIRPGTENLPGLAGALEALRLSTSIREGEDRRLRELAAQLTGRLASAGLRMLINGDPSRGLPGFVSLSFPGLSGQTLAAGPGSARVLGGHRFGVPCRCCRTAARHPGDGAESCRGSRHAANLLRTVDHG